MRILCISAQKPDSTGSGVYLAETVASLAAAGHQVAVIAGIDKDDSPQLAPGIEFLPVRFRTPELPFPVCGMRLSAITCIWRARLRSTYWTS